MNLKMTEKKTPASKPATAKTASPRKVSKKVPAKKAVADNSKGASAPATKTENTTQVPESQPAVVETHKTAHEPKVQPELKSSNGGSGKGLAALALLVSLGALGLSGYLVYSNLLQTNSTNTKLAIGLTEIKGNVGSIGDSVQALKTDMSAMNEQQNSFVTDELVSAKLTQQLTPVIDQQKGFGEALQKVREQVSGDEGRFAYDRIRQLLQTANSHLSLNRDVTGALSALRLGSEQIKALNDSRFTAVRGKVLDEINALEAVELADVASISSKLNAMQAAVANWPLQNEPDAEVIKAEVEPEDTAQGFRAELKKSMGELVKKVFQVQKIDTEPKPLLAPEQRYFLNQNLRLQLLTAQNALLQRQQTVYSSNLESAATWIRDYFDPQDTRVQQALADIAAVQGVVLQPELPDISTSLTALNTVLGN